MNFDDQVPIRVGHVFEADIPQNACIIQQDIYPPEFLNCSLDNLFPILDAVVIRHSFAASSSYLVHNYIGGLYKGL